MNPRKYKTLIEKTAKEMDIDPILVQDITSFYWSKVRKALLNLEHPRINIEGLGRLTIRPIKLKDITTEYKAMLQHINPKYFHNVHRIKDLEVKLEKLENMSLMLAKQEDDKINVKTKRIEYEKTKNNLEDNS